MPADEADGPGGRAASLGFHSYADDTLRIVPDNWSETEADADPRDWPEPERRGSSILIAAGLLLIAGLAVAFAWGVTSGRRPAPEARPAPQLQTEVAPPQQAPPSALAMTLRAAPPAPTSKAPAPGVAAPTAAPAPPAQAADARRTADPIGERLAALAPTLVAPTPAPRPATPQASEPTPVPTAQARPAFDCAAARSAAQQMICNDPELAAADRRMNRAYVAALAAGAPEDQLRNEQQDWLGIREDAARHSRRAVAAIYEQRIDDLRRWQADAAAGRAPEP